MLKFTSLNVLMDSSLEDLRATVFLWDDKQYRDFIEFFD